MSESEAPPKRGNRAGKPATAAQRAALAKGRTKRDANDKARKTARSQGEQMTKKARVAKLVSGELTVKELDLKELKRGQVHDGNGSFHGAAAHIPPKIRDQMHGEYIRRVLSKIHAGAAASADGLVKIATDPNVDPSVRLRAQQMILERTIGKVPDVVHVGAETEFDRLQQGVFEFDRSELEDEE